MVGVLGRKELGLVGEREGMRMNRSESSRVLRGTDREECVMAAKVSPYVFYMHAGVCQSAGFKTKSHRTKTKEVARQLRF